jgi:hypothetical protein
VRQAVVNGQKAPVLVAERVERAPRAGLLDHEYRYGFGFLVFVALVGVTVLAFVVGMLLGILYL